MHHIQCDDGTTTCASRESAFISGTKTPPEQVTIGQRPTTLAFDQRQKTCCLYIPTITSCHIYKYHCIYNHHHTTHVVCKWSALAPVVRRKEIHHQCKLQFRTSISWSGMHERHATATITTTNQIRTSIGTV